MGERGLRSQLAAIKASMNATPAERERAARTWGRPTAVMAMAKAIVDADREGQIWFKFRSAAGDRSDCQSHSGG